MRREGNDSAWASPEGGLVGDLSARLAGEAWQGEADLALLAAKASAVALGLADGLTALRAEDGDAGCLALDACGAAGMAIAFGSTPRWLATPAALLSGASLFAYTARASGQWQSFVTDSAGGTPASLRHSSARLLAPVLYEGLAMFAAGGLASQSLRFAPRLTASAPGCPGLTRQRLTSRADLEQKYWELFDAPEIVLARGANQPVRLLALRDMPIFRQRLKDKSLEEIVLDDAAKSEAARHFKSAHAAVAVPEGFVGIPVQARQFDRLALAVRPEGDRLATTYAKGREAVVRIEVSDASGKRRSTGSGFFVSEDGRIATALHVVDKSARIEITTADGGRHPASLIAQDFDCDLALLKVSGDRGSFSPLALSRKSGPPAEGAVVLLGYPAGSQTLFASPALFNRQAVIRTALKDGDDIVYKGRRYTEYSYFAHSRPGNSGGPVLDAEGNVIAVNTSSRAYDDIRVGFGTGVEELHKLIGRLPETGAKGRAGWSGPLPAGVSASFQARMKDLFKA